MTEATAAEPRTAPTPVRLRDGLRDSLLTFVGVRIAFSLLGLVAVGTIAPREDPPVVAGWSITPATHGWQTSW